MKREQLKAALIASWPVTIDMRNNGKIPFRCISAIIYRKRGEEIDITCEVTDMTGPRSVTIVRPEQIELVEDVKKIYYNEEDVKK